MLSYTTFDSNSWQRLVSPIEKILPESLKKVLENIGCLVDPNKDEFTGWMESNKKIAEKPGVLYRVILPTGRCQFSCSDPERGGYCGQCHVDKTLSEENQKLLIESLDKELQTGKYKRLRIAWMGGEPLLALKVIEAVSKDLISLSNKYHCKYSSEIVTNGYLLSGNIARKLVFECGIKEIGLTLDGTKEYHDKRRSLKNGAPSFDRIFSNITKVARDLSLTEAKISIRANVDKRNQDSIFPLIDKLASKNLQEKVSFYTALVRPWGNDISSFELSLKEYAKLEIEIFKKLIGAGFKVSLIPKIQRITCTVVQDNAYIIDPFGGIYKCTEAPLAKNASVSRGLIECGVTVKYRYCTGTLLEGIRENPDNKTLEDFPKYLAKLECADCKVFPVCAGGCPMMWKEGSSPCPSVKENISERLFLAYKLKKEGFSECLN